MSDSEEKGADYTGAKCATCGKEIWPNCGHEFPEDEDIVDVGYRGRGRPKLPPEQRRREKLVLALTGPELKELMIEAASTEDGPLRIQDWARRELLRVARQRKPQ